MRIGLHYDDGTVLMLDPRIRVEFPNEYMRVSIPGERGYLISNYNDPERVKPALRKLEVLLNHLDAVA